MLILRNYRVHMVSVKHIAIVCKKPSNKIRALARVLPYTTIEIKKDYNEFILGFSI